MRTMIVAAMLLVAGVAWAQDNDACLKAAQPKLDAFGECTVGKAKIAAKSSDTAEEIADAAIEGCRSHADGLREFLKTSPCDQSEEEAQYAVNGVLEQMRADLIKRVDGFRKGN